ncbi:MAG TPA: hypothetical protein PLS71_10545, partial [Leptospiraceae bacterium]|nr:hypothetical protein [Leptospiraceae bacterium]
FSAILPNQPLGKLFHELEITPDLYKVDPGMIIKMNDQKITRFSDLDKWVNEVNKHFPDLKMNQFWNKINSLEKLAWEFIDQNSNLPPRTVSDLISLIRFKNFNKIVLLKELFRSVLDELKSLQLQRDDFIQFLNEQLLITTQNRVDLSPMLTSAMGLSYPKETYYPIGGMYKPAQLLLNHFKESKGEIFLKEEVIQISFNKDCYLVRTKKGNIYKARGIISNLTTADMAKVTEGKIQSYFKKESSKLKNASGAFTIYFAVENNEILDSLYYQIHFRKKIPFIEAGAFFVSFSKEGDLEKAPIGYRTVTISTHTNPVEWSDLSKDLYKEKKEFVMKEILGEFDFHFPKMKQKIFPLGGSPKTFADYTGRHQGFVGGIPHSIQNNLIFMTPNVTPFQNLYMVGDTVFPGQGIPAVVLGAINVVNRIC